MGIAPEQFAERLREHLEELHAYARRLTATAFDAEDLVQAACERAIDRRRELRDEGHLRAWSFQIVRNLHVDRARQARARTELRLVRADDSLAPEPSVSAETVERAEADELERALGGLEPDRREVLLLSDLWGFRYEEIAELLGIPIGTVRSRLFRARAEMIARLGAQSAHGKKKEGTDEL